MMKLLAALLALAALAGCASHGVMISEQQSQQFKKGVSTEADVIAALGKPTTISTTSGYRFIIYSGAQAQARPASFIPIIGALVGGSDIQASHVMFRFDKGGILEDVTTTQTATGSGRGFAAGTPIPQTENQPRKSE